MDIDPVRFQQTVDEITRGVDEARGHIAAVPVAANAALTRTPLPPPVQELIIWTAEQIVEVTTRLFDLVEQVIAGVAAPVWFIDYASRWQDVRGTASGATAGLDPGLLPSTTQWHGDAAAAYTGAANGQRAAATKIATIAERTGVALVFCAAAGIGFYAIVAVIVVKLVAALVIALAAFASEVFSPAGAAIVLEEAAVNTGLLVTAAAALAAALGAQAHQLVVLHGEAIDNSTFPSGAWPSPATGRYSDATVTDGDADWSTRN